MCGDCARGLRTDTKQKIVEALLVLQDQWRQATGRVNTIGAYPGDQPTGPAAQTVVPHFVSHLGTIYVFREGVFLRDRPMRDCVRMIDEEPHKEEAKQYGKRKQAY